MPVPWRIIPTGLALTVRATPRASSNGIKGVVAVDMGYMSQGSGSGAGGGEGEAGEESKSTKSKTAKGKKSKGKNSGGGSSSTLTTNTTTASGSGSATNAQGVALAVSTTSPPADNAANASIAATLAKALGVSKGSVRLVGGGMGRVKRFEVMGDGEVLARRLEGEVG